MSKASKIWAQKARYDLETAESMLRDGRFIYVLFCCQQSIEKILKALLADKTGEIVSRISLKYDCVISCVFMDKERFITRNGPLLRNIRREGVAV